MSSEPFYARAKSYLDSFMRGPSGLLAGMISTSPKGHPKHTFESKRNAHEL